MPIIKRFLAILTVVFGVAFPIHAAQYTYDQLGRLTSVVESDGSSITYTYDANGNMLSITRTGATQPVDILSFAPASGAIGTSVTIRGTGFSPVAALNAVSFNGQSASVTSSNAATIVATVPAGASSGPISVIVNGNTAASAAPFLVTAVEITGFSPTMGPVGTQVVIEGSGFDQTPANNTVSFNTTAAVVSTATTTELTVEVPTGATSGRISVTAPSGSAASADDFLVPPPGFTSGQVGMTGRHESLEVGLIYTVNSTAKIAMALFDASAGQRESVVVTNCSMRGLWHLYAPDGTLVASGNLANSADVFDVGPLPAAGTYSFVMIPTIAPGSATVRVVPELPGSLQTDGTALPTALAAGRNAEFSFTAVAGESYTFILHNYNTTIPEATAQIKVLRPDGSQLKLCNGVTGGSTNCHFDADQAGVHRLRVDPAGLAATTFDARLSTDFRATLSSGVPMDLELTVPGRTARLDFSVSAGQAVSVSVGAISYTSPASSSRLYIYNAAGSEIEWYTTYSSSLVTANLPTLPAGNYRAWFVPGDAATATFRAQLEAVTPATLLPNGVSSSFSAGVSAQTIFYTFAGTQGQNLGLGFTNVSFASGANEWLNARVVRPNGTIGENVTCDVTIGRCQLSLRNLPSTGAYRVEVITNTNSVQRTNVTATLSQSVTGTLTQGSPLPVTLSYPGQNALLSFVNPSMQSLSLNAGLMALTPAGAPVKVRFFNAAGNYVGSATSSTTASLPLPNLTAGTYSALVEPTTAATGSMQVLISQGTPVPVDGSPNSFSATGAGEKAYFTFAGTAGQSIGIGLTNLTLAPASPTYVSLRVFKPDNAQLTSVSCYVADNGCQLALRNLPTTGTYRIEVTPGTSQVMGFSLRLVPVSITAISPSTTAIPLSFDDAGEFADFSFVVTAGQYATLRLGAPAMSPANSDLTIRVYNPSGTQVGYAAMTNNPVTLNLTNLVAGTYRVVVAPTYAATGSAELTFSPPLVDTLAADGTTANYNTGAAGQFGYFTFSGTVGQNLGLGITGLALSPTSPTYMTWRVVKPDGSQLISGNCSTQSSGCQIAMRSLPVTGTYRLQTEPSAQQSASFSLTLSESNGGAITPSTTPITTNFGVPGQNAVYSFTSVAGQAVTIRMDSMAMSPANSEVMLRLFNPSGSQVSSTTVTTAGSTLNLTGLVAGTYTITVVPTYAATGSLQFTLAPQYGGSLASNGSPNSYATPVPGQVTYLTFSANAGDYLGIGLTGLTLSPSSPDFAPLKLYRPNNAFHTNVSCDMSNNGCQLTLRAAPLSGTYRLEFEPGLQQSASFDLTLSQPVTGTLSAGTPLPITLGSPGQIAVVTFTATSGQSIPVTLGSLAMSPSGGQLIMSLYGPSGIYLDSANATTSPITRNYNNLPAGTYTLIVAPPFAATGSFQLSRP